MMFQQFERYGCKLACFCMALCVIVSSLSAAPIDLPAPEIKNILVIYPEMAGRPGIIDFDNAFRQHLRELSPQNIQFYNEFLDISRFPSDKHQQQFASFLKNKYTGIKIDMIVVALRPSFDFILKHRDDIFPGVPVVFSAVEQRELQDTTLPGKMAGVPMHFDIEATLQLALGIHPNTKKVYVVSGSSKYDIHWKKQADPIFQRYANRIEVIYLADLSIQQLLEELQKPGKDSFVYYMHMQIDKAGASFAAPEVLAKMLTVCKVPIYGHLQVYQGKGIVGGKLMSFENEGRNAAWLVSRMLQGELLQGIIEHGEVQNKIIVDWREYERWASSQSQLPPEVIFVNYQPTIWEQYRWQIFGAIALCLAQGLLIAGLMLQRHSRQQAENRFRLSVEASPYGMVMVGKNGSIEMVNAQMEKLFGYSRSELQSIPLEQLVPVKLMNAHTKWREHYFNSPISRPMGPERELFARRKDGTEFPVEIGLNPVTTDGKTFVLATIIDISERKKTASRLEQHQQELVALSGKLLTAQESESRRIARELHDDLNQNLALVSVELDMLAKRPDLGADERSQHITDLSSKVKQLSSFVHDLSHQLHPAKLEQLGLVKSLRGLCRELSASRDVVIDYDVEDIGYDIPMSTAICFYRIAQEALHNAIKHSDSEVIEVRLFTREKQLVMTIEDDGKGFDLEGSCENHGIGLLSMRERIRLEGGTIHFHSQPGEGTQLEVSAPIACLNAEVEEDSCVTFEV